MKRGAQFDPQSQFIQLCIALLASGNLKESATNLVQFINEGVSREELNTIDFNVKIEEVLIEGETYTALSFVVDLAIFGEPEPLKTILEKVDVSKLDFNVEGNSGTLFHKITLSAYQNNNPDILHLILDKGHLQNLDFNASIITNKTTPLKLISLMAIQGMKCPLETVLKKVDLSLLNFNIKANNGDTPLWWLALSLVNGKINSKILESVLAGDLSKFDFNATYKNMHSVLSLLVIAASQGNVKPLLMILKKGIIEKFEITEKMEREILLRLVFTAMKGYHEPLKIFLSNKISENWNVDDRVKSILSQESHDQIDEILSDMIINQRSILRLNEVLPICVSDGYTQLALGCIKAGANTQTLNNSLPEALKNGNYETVINLFPYYKFYNIPILEILQNKTPIDIETIKKFMDNPLIYFNSQVLLPKKILDQLQNTFILHCMDLFSTDNIEDKIRNFTLFLKKVPLHILDYQISEGPFKGNTPLWVIALAAYRGKNLLPIQIILKALNEEEVAKLNFNISPPNGKYTGKTVLWLIVKVATNDLDNSDVFVLTELIKKANFSQLNFDAKAQAQTGTGKGQTVLWLAARMSREFPFFLEAILTKIKISSLNFNEPEEIRKTTPLWWIARLAAVYRKPALLQLVLDNSDISRLNLNEIAMERTVLYMVITAAAHGLVGPLQTILKNEEIISNLDFEFKPPKQRSIPFLLILVALSGHPELLRTILSNKKLNSRWFDEFTCKIIFEKSNEEICAYFIERISNTKKEILEKNILTCIRFGHTKAALACLQKGADTRELYDALYDANVNDYQETVKTLFPYCQFFGIPIINVLEDKSFFNSFDNISEFLNSEDQLFYLSTLTSEITRKALFLLKLDKEVKAYEDEESFEDEPAMADAKVKRALWHFSKNVQPAFKNKLLSYADTEDKAILEIEKKIRLLILNSILEQAKSTIASLNMLETTDFTQIQIQQNQKKLEEAQAVIAFVTNHKDDLFNLDETVMKESCKVFNSKNLNDTALAAWRGYNPYAPVTGKWPNLLTPPISKKKIWTIEIDDKSQKRDPMEVYHLLRKWVAYYYLVVTDEEGDENTHQTRIINFISQLAYIRNAHAIDDPSCFPATLTRIADMGAFHSLGQLPPTIKNLLIDHFKAKILALFEEKLKSLSTMEEKESLYFALTILTRDTAKDIIQKSTIYKEAWLTLREDFISALGTPEDNLISIVEGNLFPIVEEDILYILQILNDIAGDNEIHVALSESFNRHTDRIPTKEDFGNANLFEENTENHELFQLLFDNILKYSSEYSKSVRRLNALVTYLTQKLSVIRKSGNVDETLQGLQIEDTEVLSIINSKLQNKTWWRKPICISNPFDRKVFHMKKLGKIENLKNLENKQLLFNQYSPLVQEAFKEIDVSFDFLSRFTEAVVMFVLSNKGWYFETFIYELQNCNFPELEDSDTLIFLNNFDFLKLKVLEMRDKELKREDKVLEWDDLVINAKQYTPLYTQTSLNLEAPSEQIPNSVHVNSRLV